MLVFAILMSCFLQKVVSSLKAMRHRVCSVKDFKDMHWVKGRLRDKVIEILETGRLAKLEAKKKNPRLRALVEIARIWGVGPVTAAKLYGQGYKSVEDLRKPEAAAVLTAQQQIGVKHYEDLLTKIPRYATRLRIICIPALSADSVKFVGLRSSRSSKLSLMKFTNSCQTRLRWPVAPIVAESCHLEIAMCWLPTPTLNRTIFCPSYLSASTHRGFLQVMLATSVLVAGHPSFADGACSAPSDDLTHFQKQKSGGCDTYMGVCRVSKVRSCRSYWYFVVAVNQCCVPISAGPPVSTSGHQDLPSPLLRLCNPVLHRQRPLQPQHAPLRQQERLESVRPRAHSSHAGERHQGATWRKRHLRVRSGRVHRSGTRIQGPHRAQLLRHQVHRRGRGQGETKV